MLNKLVKDRIKKNRERRLLENTLVNQMGMSRRICKMSGGDFTTSEGMQKIVERNAKQMSATVQPLIDHVLAAAGQELQDAGLIPKMPVVQTFTLWTEGYAATGQSSDATYHGQIQGVDFNDAVKNYVATLPESSRSYWNFRNDKWDYWACRAFDNESDARRSFG